LHFADSLGKELIGLAQMHFPERKATDLNMPYLLKQHIESGPTSNGAGVKETPRESSASPVGLS